jgi:hypothetical protein
VMKRMERGRKARQGRGGDREAFSPMVGFAGERIEKGEVFMRVREKRCYIFFY